MDPDEEYWYQITIQGTIDSSWAEWLGALSIRTRALKGGGCLTILTGPVADQSALRGIITTIWDLNLELIAVQRVRKPAKFDTV